MVDPRTALQEKDIRPIHKVDTKTSTRLSWSEAGLNPGEPVFIANPDGVDEDDGVIVTIVLDFKTNTAFMLLLDAKTMTEIARSYAPFAIPIGLHGQHFNPKN